MVCDAFYVTVFKSLRFHPSTLEMKRFLNDAFSKVSSFKDYFESLLFYRRFQKQQDIYIFTPRYVRVSPEYICLVGLNDGDGVTFSVTPAVEFNDTKLVHGSAEAQQPLRIIANSRRKELPEIDVVELVVCDYCGAEQGYWKQNEG